MILNHYVIVERYPFFNGVVGSSIHVVKSSLYLMKKNYVGYVGRKPRTHPPQGRE
jgi:hypothetical protein